MDLNPEWRNKREMEEIKQVPTAKVAVETYPTTGADQDILYSQKRLN